MNVTSLQKFKGRALAFGASVALIASSFAVSVAPARAAASLVQEDFASNTTSTSYNATYGSATTADNLLVAVIGARGNSVTAIGTPSGWTQIGSTIINGSTPRSAQALFYKIATGSETTVTASFTGAPVTSAITIYEFAGGTFTLQDSNSGTDSGSGGTALSAGSVTTTSADELIFVAYQYTNNGTSTTVSSWNGEAATEIYDFEVDSSSQDSSYSTAYDVTNVAGTHNGNATVPGSTRWSGHIAAFTVAGGDTTAPTLAVVTPVSATTYDRTPNFTFSSDEAGTISYQGSCASTSTVAADSSNTITLGQAPTGSGNLSIGLHADCDVRVTDGSGNASDWLEIPNFSIQLGDSSDSSSNFIAANISLALPNGGETYAGGSAASVVWSHMGTAVTGVRLSFSKDNGSTWSTFATGETGGSFSWTVPMVSTTEGRVRAEAMNGSTVEAFDVSESTFTITVPPGTEEDVLTPNPDDEDSGSDEYIPSNATSLATSINVDKGLNGVTPPENPLCVSGSLIKLPSDNDSSTQIDSTVYYCGQDGKRYVFPNQKTFNTWFADFSSVVEISAADMAAIQLGGNITYKPGVRMLKLTTDPKVYAVDNGGVLRWVTSTLVAEELYGSNWATKIDDLSDAYAVDYTIGQPIY